MSYKRKTKSVLAGSLSYLPPGDLINDQDALALTNFRADQQGALRSRLGHTSLYTGLTGSIRSLIKALSHRYAGSTVLYLDGSSHATGFSGQPMGFVDWKQWLWVMDQSKQGKSDGTNFRNWAIEAPEDPPTVAPATEVTEEVVTFDDSESWSVDPSGNDSFDSGEKQEGTHSLQIEAPEDQTYTLTLGGLTLDLSEIGGEDASDDDVHRIWVFCKQFKKIEEITLEVDVNGGDFSTDYYTATITRKLIKKARKGWFRFEVRKRQLVDPFTSQPIEDKKNLPFFTRIGATGGKDWSTVEAVRIKLDTRKAVTVRFDLWEVFGSVTGTIEGEDVQYFYTYVNDSGHESNPSPASPKIAFNRTGASLSDLTASTDPQVTGKNIYRTGGTLGAVYRVNSTPLANATTTYTDTASDDDIRRLGFQMKTDNDAPPAAQVLVGPYFGRLIAARSSDHKNRFWWTEQNEPYKFPGAAKDKGFFADAGDTDEIIVQIIMRPRMLTIYKENTIWRVIGDPGDTDGQQEITRATLGAIGQNAVCMAGEVDYFQGKEGVFSFNGDTAREISQKIRPIFKGDTVTLSSGVTVAPVSSSARDKSVLGFINGRLYFSYAEEGQSNPNVTLVYEAETGDWYRDSRGFTSINYEGQNGSLLGGTSGGDVLTLETGSTDAGSAIAVNYQSKYYDFGAPDSDKTHEDFTIEIDSAGATLTVTAFLNNGATSVALGTVSGSGRTRSVLQFNSGLGTKARNISIRVTGSVSSPITIYKATLNYYFEARQAKSFDTDEVPLGEGKMALVREIQLDLDNAAQVTLTVQSDQPGEAMATRQQPTIALSTTRRMAHTVFSSDYRGFLHRFILSGTDFRLYGARAFVKVIGTYLLGAKGQFYKSDPLDFGTERVKLCREIELDIDNSGNTALALLTDLPGGVMTSRLGATTIAATSGEQTVKVRVPGTIKGRLLQLNLTPAADLIIYAIRMNVKTIGEPNASSWQWIELPVEQTQDGVWVKIPFPVDEVA
jgi:hypothetical protein